MIINLLKNKGKAICVDKARVDKEQERIEKEITDKDFDDPHLPAIVIVAKCKVKTALGVEAELRRRIKNRFDAEGIEIPFPQQVVHLVKEA